MDEVMAEVEKDRAFYRRSGGGMTVGAASRWPSTGFAAALLEAARNAYRAHRAGDLRPCAVEPFRRRCSSTSICCSSI